jgi:putative thioredoxin
VAILELLTPPQPKPDPTAAGKTAAGIELVGKTTVEQDETTAMLNAYRRKLSMALN